MCFVIFLCVNKIIYNLNVIFNSDVVTAVSNDLKKTTNRLFKIKNDIQVIYNFIDTKKYDKANQQKCNRIAIAKSDERILTHVSNFRPVKRVEDVIKVFYQVHKKISE